MRLIRGFSLLVIKRSLRTVRTGPRGTITTKLQGLLTNELIEESMRLEEEIDIELIDIRERINKYYTVEDNNGFVKLTSKHHELQDSNKPKVEIMWHIQVRLIHTIAIAITLYSLVLYLIRTILVTIRIMKISKLIDSSITVVKELNFQLPPPPHPRRINQQY